MKKTTQLNWVRYYRNSLADGEMYDIRTKDCKNGYYFDSFSDLTSRKLKEIYNKFKDKPKKKSDTEEEENQYPIDVFISPLYYSSRNPQ
ncbi:MAG: hypothetical protein WC951_12460 [Bacteroidales bacterium]|nr:hypothetical protein [Tenuifilaceae bacterium]